MPTRNLSYPQDALKAAASIDNHFTRRQQDTRLRGTVNGGTTPRAAVNNEIQRRAVTFNKSDQAPVKLEICVLGVQSVGWKCP